MRAEIQLTRDTRAEHVAALMAEHKPALCIVDSIQTVTVEGTARRAAWRRSATALPC